MKKYIITANCNPYHAKFYYNGERVLRYNGCTPVEWVADDNFGDGFSSEEAAASALMAMAKNINCDDWSYEDDASIAEIERQIKEDTGESIKVEWYKGPGVYDTANCFEVLLEGETSFDYDTMTWSVEKEE